MRKEPEIILSVLKLTKNGQIQKDQIAEDARTSATLVGEVLRTLRGKGLVQLEGRILRVSPSQRIQLAIEAIKQGADIEHASRFLEWKEFENIAAAAFETNGFKVKRNFHFKANDKRWEIDLVAQKKPLIACVDCKHWQHGWTRASIIRTTEAQVERTRALADSLQNFTEKLELDTWSRATLIPIVLSLVQGTFKFHEDTPIVPVLQLQSFINELPVQSFSLTHFSKNVRPENTKLTEF